MINFRKVKRFVNEDLSLIENYDKAISDSNQTWDCHHRREITTPRKELIEIGEYYNRPAIELIFLTRNEHMAIHASLFFKGKPSWNKGRRLTNEHKRQISKALKGHTLSEEARRKIAEGNKGKKMSEEAKLKIGEYGKMSHWFNNGIITVRAKSCPEGFVRGRLKKKTQRT